MATISEIPHTPYIARSLDLRSLLEKRSFFLFGPRQTGTTSLILHTLADVRYCDLLDWSIFLALSRNPGRLAEELSREEKFVVIDEIQRLPDKRLGRTEIGREFIGRRSL